MSGMVRMKLVIPAVLLMTLFALSAAFAADKGGLSIPPGAKCPVCGMFVAKYPDWVASARFKDGHTSYYDGPKDMFSHYFDPAHYTPGRRTGDVVSMSVTEYYSLAMIDARAAFFVSGSDVYGPMGSELIPFKTEEDARSFKLDHRGKQILRFNELTPQIIKSLN
ncbi:MAG: nitrous oxide reductase accessory protein NosL [Desulfuromonadaceae bacterium]|nr:nitrous oxide reductase accessory protein NosL [Desulfuromonadaceae bacterium]